ncbi:hypothetical protein GCM10010342_51600 [Streptomyces anulatus]|nr:hypothetical protein GCM10010342_51600 [Streptomyces anulatus]
MAYPPVEHLAAPSDGLPPKQPGPSLTHPRDASLTTPGEEAMRVGAGRVQGGHGGSVA